MNNLTPIQIEIIRGLNAMGGKTKFTESLLAKKIRELNKLDSKKKAGIALLDLEKAIQNIQETDGINYALTVNSVNDIIIKKVDAAKLLSADARQRRLRSEKSMSVLSSGDLRAPKK